MSDQETRPQDRPDGTADDDTEGQAFTWSAVDDPKTGKRLRQSWSPDDPKDSRSSHPGSAARKPSQPG